MNIDIAHIAKLSRLHIEENKMQKFEKDMQDIVEMANKLPRLNEELSVDESSIMTLREDKAESGKFTRDELFANAPQVKAGCLVVPKTVE